MSRVRPPHALLRDRAVRVAVGAGLVLAAVPLATSSPAAAAPAAPVDLGSAATYSVLAGAGVSSAGAATVLALDLGLSPSGAVTGFPPGTVTGTIHDKDTAAATAQEDRQAAYDAVAAQTGGTPFAGDQAGTIFKPGLHTSAAAFTNTGTIVLDADGDPGAVFVFQIGAALSSAAATKVVLADGALAHNVYWQVVGAVSLGAGAKWVGTFLAAGAVSFGEGASIKGRILTPGTVVLANSPVTQPVDDLTAPLISVDGGPARSTSDPTPLVTGTTDEPAGRAARVLVDGQALAAPVTAGGVWAVSALTLSEGPHNLLATITDPSGNSSSATQVLTVDTAAPAVTVTGGDSAATKDASPTISGTTNEPGAPTVTVTVGGQTMTAAAVAGTWAVDAALLTEATHLVVASVDDAAGNTGSASQVLDVDVTVPVVTIDGGPTRSTDDTSPWTYGTTAEKSGTTVHVSIGGQALTATVLPGGTWGVSAATLPAGTYAVVASVTDAAQNTGTASQTLTIGPGVGTVPPPAGGGGPTSGPEPRYRPDAEIRKAKGSYVGANSYEVSDQRVTSRLRRAARTATFEVRVTNRGDGTDKVALLGTRGSAKFAVVYLAGGEDVTAAVLDGSYRTTALKPGESVTLVLRVTRAKGVREGSRTFQVRSSSAHDGQRRDTVAAVVRSGAAG